MVKSNDLNPDNLTISIIGTGWLGLPLAIHLNNRGHQLYASSRNPEQLRELETAGLSPFLLSLESGNLKIEPDKEEVWQADVFVITIPPASAEPEFLNGMGELLDKILKDDKKKRIIYTSSTGVYGSASGWINENAPLNPDRASAKTILNCEELIRQKATNFTILRLAGLVGKNRKPGNFFAGKKELSNADSPVNLVHLDDCVQIISKLAESGIRVPVLNVCADIHPKHSDFYTKESLKLGLPMPEYLREPTSKDLKIIDNSLLKKTLLYSFLHPDPSEFPL